MTQEFSEVEERLSSRECVPELFSAGALGWNHQVKLVEACMIYLQYRGVTAALQCACVCGACVCGACMCQVRI